MKISNNKNVLKFASAAVVVLAIGVFADIFHASAIIGPSGAGGVGSGAISTDASGDIAIGTSTTQSNTKFFILGSTTDSSAYGLQIWNSNSTSTFYVRNDGMVSIPGTVTIGTLSATVNASNISSGQFGAGNFIFPAGLSIATTTLVSNSYFYIASSTNIFVALKNGNIGIGIDAPAYDLDVVGNGHFSGYLLLSTTTLPSSALFHIATSTSIFTVLSNGNVGVQNSAPAYDLDVNGTGHFAGQLTMASAQQITWASTNTSNNINMQNGTISGVSKLTVATIDPMYEINGQKYATYSSSIAGGVNEEFVGHGQLQKTGDEAKATFVLDFGSVPIGSDLWVWKNAVDFSSDNVEVLATPISNPVSIAYNIEGNKIVFTGTGESEFSYRLIGKRLDWKNWPTYAKNQNEVPSIVIP